MRHRTDALSLVVPVDAANIDQALTAVEIQDSIDRITETLRGSLPNVERAFLVADRRELRERLAQIEKSEILGYDSDQLQEFRDDAEIWGEGDEK